MRRALPFWALLSIGALACSPGGPTRLETCFDLVEETAVARLEAEAGRIVPDAPEAHRHLLSGFSRPETDGRGEAFVWSVGEEARLGFFLFEPRPLELRFSARPLRFPGAPPQRIEFASGERSLATVELTPARGEYKVELPAEALTSGANVLTLRPAWHRPPAEVIEGSTDRRSLAVAWYGFAFGPGAAPKPRLDTEAGLLELPAGLEVSYYLRLPAKSHLRFERLSFRGGGRLEVFFEEEGEEERLLAELAETQVDEAVAFGLEAGRLARLTLRSRGPDNAVAALFSPTVEARVPVEVEARVPVEAPAPPEPPPPPSRPDVVFYLIDTLRADHLGCYGYAGGTSPAIDAFAEDALVFERSVAQSSWTKASVASIFTGLGPRVHAANGRGDRLSGEAETMAEILARESYATAAFVTNPNVTETFGFDQGFEHFHYLGAGADAEEVRREVMGWLEARDDARPLFLYVHTLDPHSPYTPPAEYRERFAPGVAPEVGSKTHIDDLQAGRRAVNAEELAGLRAVYDAEIAWNDMSFGAFLDDLRRLDVYDDALIALLSDHGEEFYEHGNFTHGRSLHGESLRVPLVVRFPGGEPRGRVALPVAHLDLLPTLVAHLGLEAPSDLPGRDLAAVAEMARDPLEAAGALRAIHSYLHLDGPARASVREGRYKMIHQLAGGELVWPRLYDLEFDPGELEELSESHPVRAGHLATVQRRHLFHGGAGLEAEAAVVDEELRQSLRALGYVQ